MFSAGNITEKLRVASFQCSGEVVVDLYAGRTSISLKKIIVSFKIAEYKTGYVYN